MTTATLPPASAGVDELPPIPGRNKILRLHFFGTIRGMLWSNGLSVVDSILNDLSSSAGRGHCVMFLGNTLLILSQCLSLPRSINGYW